MDVERLKAMNRLAREIENQSKKLKHLEQIMDMGGAHMGDRGVYVYLTETQKHVCLAIIEAETRAELLKLEKEFEEA